MSSTHPAERGQGRELLIEAARAVFAEKGFARAGIREIASRAGVTEPVVYWHFKSKRGLFEAAVSEPFAAFLRDFFGAWKLREPGVRSAVDEATDYLSGLYDVLHSERELLIAMLADREFGAGTTSAMQTTIAELLAFHEERLAPEAAERGYRPFDIAAWTRIFFAATFTLAVFGDLVEPDGVDRDRYVREFAEMIIYGALPQE